MTTTARRTTVRRTAQAFAAASLLCAAGTGTAMADTQESTDSYPAVWNDVADCESSGDWSINTGNGFHGGLQFTDDTWDGFGGEKYADSAEDATPEQQVEIAQEVLQEQGPEAWPVCSDEAGLTVENGS